MQPAFAIKGQRRSFRLHALPTRTPSPPTAFEFDRRSHLFLFEILLVMLLGAAVLSLVAERIGVPYPTLLALAGAALAFAPGMPHLQVPPELILALFVAPVLLDAAHDASWRDLKTNWRPVLSLVLVAVGLTTMTVAVVARLLVPDMSWAAAIALGALLAPPDAVAALAVMRAVSPPHRLRVVLEGESLFNDASALLIYKLALTSVAVGTFSIGNVAPALLLVSVGSAAAGWILATLVTRLTALVRDPAIATIIQFVGTFGVWLLAERLELSGVITVVVFGVTAGRRSSGASFTEVRIKSFAAWDTATRILNVLAFTMVGLQLRPIAASLTAAQARDYPLYALAILAIVIVVRLVWVLLYGVVRLISGSQPDEMLGTWSGTLKSGLVVGWSGMRGIVTIAAALALPQDFPQREFVQLVAFVVVLGTLVLQGLTLKPLLKALRFPPDTVVEDEIRLAREAIARAALRALDGREGEAAERLRRHLAEGVATSERGEDMFSDESRLRLAVLPASRQALDQLRDRGEIGDDAFRFVEQELDWSELTAQSHRYE
ncbi:cation:proton antiporter [Sphingomonas elodea]|uniref:cation:proton antiporter n=1 Tax=Sphingomonas elodea TaxID=179878 RepID=UPI00192B757D|nr:sodium:proton antiporter [Sphingomonas elodea]